MSRRAHIVYGRGGNASFGRRLGFGHFGDVYDFVEYHWKFPTIDFERAERRSGHRIEPLVQEEMQGEFERLLTGQLAVLLANSSELTKETFGVVKHGTLSNQEFKKLVRKLNSRARKFREALDELVAFDAELAFPPHDTRMPGEFPSSLRFQIDDDIAHLEPVFRPSEEDLLDYLSFRKTLDYFEYFEEKNRRFNNWYHERWTDADDHSLFELLVRRLFFKLRDSGFPTSLTVPTDVAPEYESPCVAVLLVVQDSWNEALGPTIDKGIYPMQQLNYRQMLYLISKILEDFARLQEAFASLRYR